MAPSRRKRLRNGPRCRQSTRRDDRACRECALTAADENMNTFTKKSSYCEDLWIDWTPYYESWLCKRYFVKQGRGHPRQEPWEEKLCASKIVKRRMKFGRLHCTTGPALVRSRNGRTTYEYYLHGLNLRRDQHQELTKDRPDKLTLAMRVIDMLLNWQMQRSHMIVDSIQHMQRMLKRPKHKRMLDNILLLHKALGKK